MYIITVSNISISVINIVINITYVIEHNELIKLHQFCGIIILSFNNNWYGLFTIKST